MDVIDELIAFEDNVDRDSVERRSQDWERRLNDLYSDVAAWRPAGWRVRHGDDVGMHEDLMRRADMPARALPCRLLEKDAQRRGRLEPRNLWIIGANGRVDLILSDRHDLIVDRSENFAAADWQMADLRDRMNEVPFTRTHFLQSLA
jgi:hypothetical protein